MKSKSIVGAAIALPSSYVAIHYLSMPVWHVALFWLCVAAFPGLRGFFSIALTSLALRCDRVPDEERHKIASHIALHGPPRHRSTEESP